MGRYIDDENLNTDCFGYTCFGLIVRCGYTGYDTLLLVALGYWLLWGIGCFGYWLLWVLVALAVICLGLLWVAFGILSAFTTWGVGENKGTQQQTLAYNSLCAKNSCRIPD